MLFSPLPLEGAFILDIEAREDPRGLFARTFCVGELAEHGLVDRFVQCNTSFNTLRGTLRGMHYQADPHQEIKIVRCTRGRILDVIVDLRGESPTFKRSIAVELTADNRRALYVPAGFGHGFQTLEDNCEVFYHMSEFYYPDLARGVRWNDPAFAMEWPILPPILSERDAAYPDFCA